MPCCESKEATEKVQEHPPSSKMGRREDEYPACLSWEAHWMVTQSRAEAHSQKPCLTNRSPNPTMMPFRL